MGDLVHNPVDTASCHARWEIKELSSSNDHRCQPFKMSQWNWLLDVESFGPSRNLSFRLYPERSNSTIMSPPIASLIVRATVGDRRTFIYPEVRDWHFKFRNDFRWETEIPFSRKFVVHIEFLDLKIRPPTGGKACSIWGKGFLLKQPHTNALGRMLSESIYTDIVINRSIKAHRAVLATNSPVFGKMFSHDLKEKQQSNVTICDMSMEARRAFINYMYGNISSEEFLNHRLELLQAAEKYDVSELKEACHESLLDNIDTTNVLERLQYASPYQLPKLKASCLCYLVKFGYIFKMRDDLNSFMQRADRDLVAEILNEVLDMGIFARK